MSDERSETPDPSAESFGAESLLGAAGSAEAREALARLGERARSIVEQLARSASDRDARSASYREAFPGSAGVPEDAIRAADSKAKGSMLDAAMPELHRRLGELRACIGEVSDVLEATVERLETVEAQLGDADEQVERTIADGIARCEHMIAGIEHRVSRVHAVEKDRACEDLRASAQAFRTVIVVAGPSRLRAGLCVALERQGLLALAALDAIGARRALDRSGGAAAALLAFSGSAEDRLLAMEQWKSAQRDGLLPPAAVWIRRDEEPAALRDAAVCELPVLLESHGEAALAAALLEMTRTRERPA
jgi:hypothetical protein